MGKNVIEILIIVLLILTIITVHILPTIVNSVNNINWTPPIEEFNNKCPKINIKTKVKNGIKYTDIFEQWQLDNVLDKIHLSEEIESDFKGFQRQGTHCTLLKNDALVEKIENMIDWDNKHLIYLIKAKNGHHINPGHLLMLYNEKSNELTTYVKSKLKEVKSIWYMFVNLDWKFENRWIFKDIENDTYYAPENNTIIEFKQNQKYELSSLNTDEDKYFILIYNL